MKSQIFTYINTLNYKQKNYQQTATIVSFRIRNYTKEYGTSVSETFYIKTSLLAKNSVILSINFQV